MPRKATVQGQDRLQSTLRAAGRALAGPAMTAPAREAATVMVRAVRARTPRRTGGLAASIRPAPGGTLGAGRSAAVTSGLSYTAPREFGVGPRRGLTGGHNIRGAHMFAKGAKDANTAAVEAATDAVQGTMRRVKGA